MESPDIFRHHRALNMPAGTSLAPGRLPERLSVLFRLPENEISGILLILLAGYLKLPETRLEILQILV